MAAIIPSIAPHSSLTTSHRGELETLRQLQSGLSDDFAVFHNVHWSRSTSNRTAFGEIDFVIVNRSGDALIIEQKNGALQEDLRGLVKHYGDRSKYVGDQVRRSLENLREKFREHNPAAKALKLDYLIYCPDYRVQNLNAASLDRNRVVDSRDRDRLADRVRKILGTGDPDGQAQAKALKAFLRHSLAVVPDIHAHISAQKREYTRLSGGLVDFVSNIEMKPLRLQIKGAAGCGKSLLAAQFYETASEVGQRPLLVCFNRPLKERFAALLGKDGKVATFHGLCDEFLQASGRQIDFSTSQSDPRFWQRLAESVVEETIPESWKFDRLIVDEGQDFEDEWLEILRVFLQPEHDLIWLEDQNQNIYGKAPVHLENFVGFRARWNHRSPRSIAEVMAEVLPFDIDCGNDLPGLGVGFTAYDDTEAQLPMVAKIVSKLIKQGFAHHDIAILTCRGFGNSVFSAAKRVGPHILRRFTGDYDMFGNQVLTDGKLRFESVFRFKGQQAPVVILVDVDPDEAKLERFQRVLYCGMSRATVRLEILSNKHNPTNRHLFGS
jgi:hypothetical protein